MSSKLGGVGWDLHIQLEERMDLRAGRQSAGGDQYWIAYHLSFLDFIYLFFFFSFLLLQLFFVISILILFYFIHFSPVLLPSPLCGGECFSNCMLLSCWLGLNYNSMILCMFVKYNPEEKKKSYSSSCLQCSALYFTVFRICVWGTTVFWQQILFTLSLLWVLLSLF